MFTIIGTKSFSTFEKIGNVVYRTDHAQKIRATYDDNRNRVSIEILADLNDSKKRVGVDDNDNYDNLTTNDNVLTYQNNGAYKMLMDVMHKKTTYKYDVNYKRDDVKPCADKTADYMAGIKKSLESFRNTNDEMYLYYASVGTVRNILKDSQDDFALKMLYQLSQFPMEYVSYDGNNFGWQIKKWKSEYEIPQDAYQLVIDCYYAYIEWLAVYGMDAQIIINNRVCDMQRYAYMRVTSIMRRIKAYRMNVSSDIESLSQKSTAFVCNEHVRQLEARGLSEMVDHDEIFHDLLKLLPSRTLRMLGVYIACQCDRQKTAQVLGVSDDVIQGLFRRLRKTLEKNDINISDFDCYGFKTASETSKMNVSDFVYNVAQSKNIDVVHFEKALEWKRKTRKQSLVSIVADCQKKTEYIDKILTDYETARADKKAKNHEHVKSAVVFSSKEAQLL